MPEKTKTKILDFSNKESTVKLIIAFVISILLITAIILGVFYLNSLPSTAFDKQRVPKNLVMFKNNYNTVVLKPNAIYLALDMEFEKEYGIKPSQYNTLIDELKNYEYDSLKITDKYKNLIFEGLNNFGSYDADFFAVAHKNADKITKLNDTAEHLVLKNYYSKALKRLDSYEDTKILQSVNYTAQNYNMKHAKPLSTFGNGTQKDSYYPKALYVSSFFEITDTDYKVGKYVTKIESKNNDEYRYFQDRYLSDQYKSKGNYLTMKESEINSNDTLIKTLENDERDGSYTSCSDFNNLGYCNGFQFGGGKNNIIDVARYSKLGVLYLATLPERLVEIKDITSVDFVVEFLENGFKYRYTFDISNQANNYEKNIRLQKIEATDISKNQTLTQDFIFTDYRDKSLAALDFSEEKMQITKDKYSKGFKTSFPEIVTNIKRRDTSCYQDSLDGKKDITEQLYLNYFDIRLDNTDITNQEFYYFYVPVDTAYHFTEWDKIALNFTLNQEQVDKSQIIIRYSGNNQDPLNTLAKYYYAVNCQGGGVYTKYFIEDMLELRDSAARKGQFLKDEDIVNYLKGSVFNSMPRKYLTPSGNQYVYKDFSYPQFQEDLKSISVYNQLDITNFASQNLKLPRDKEYKPQFPVENNQRYDLLNNNGAFVHVKDSKILIWTKNEEKAFELINSLKPEKLIPLKNPLN